MGIEHVSSQVGRIETRIPLLNASSDVPLDFGGGLSIRAVTPEEAARWSRDEHVRDVVPHRVFAEIRWLLIAEHQGRKPEELEYLLMAFFGAASLLAGREVQAAFSEEVFVQPDGTETLVHGTIRIFPLNLPVSSAPPWQGPIPLHGLCEAVFTASNRFYGNGLFRFALSRWLYAQNKSRRSAEDAVLDLSIALEAVFIGRDESDVNIAKTLRERICVFWSGSRSGKNARLIRDKVHDAYEVRSLIAHGEVVADARLDAARKDLDMIVRETLLDFGGGALADFDPRTLWDAPTRECRARHESS